jgi:L-2,4-diaminobutyric acid acetyltransferase
MNLIHHKDDVLMRKPVRTDGAQIYELIRRSPPLDLNSAYCYFLICEHFADTSVVCVKEGEVIGFVSAYRPANRPETLFVWQVAVDGSQRGTGLAGLMLSSLIARPDCAGVTQVETTITPSNTASRRLFERLAERHGAEIHTEEFIPGDALGEQHEAEVLHRIAPLSGHSVEQ